MPPTTLIDVLPLRIPDTTIFIFNDKAGGCTSHSISFELEILHISRWHRRIMAAPKIILNETMVSYPSQKFHSHPPWTRQLVGGSKVYPYMAHLHSSRRGRQFLVPPEPCHLQSLRRRTWMSPLDVDSAYQTFHRVESDTVIYRAIVNQRKLRKAWQKYLLNHLFSWWCLRSQRFCWWTKSCVPGMYATLWKWVLYLGKHHLNQGSWGRIIVIFDTTPKHGGNGHWMVKCQNKIFKSKG